MMTAEALVVVSAHPLRRHARLARPHLRRPQQPDEPLSYSQPPVNEVFVLCTLPTRVRLVKYVKLDKPCLRRIEEFKNG